MTITLTSHAVEVLKTIQLRREDPSELIVERALELLALDLNGGRSSTPVRSILELQGLGKALWQGVEAQEYVDRERAAWTG